MFKRYLVVCKQQHHIALIVLLIFIVGSQNISAQQQIATDTYAIFQQSCLICHGVDGAYKETLLMEHEALIAEGTVIPGNPDASLLYDRVIGTPGSGPQMPLGQPPLSAQAINTIRNWILVGHYEWHRNDGWRLIESAYPYHISFDAPAQAALKGQLTRLQRETGSDIPSVHVDWFIANASLPPLYHHLLSLPLTDRELETRLEVDVAQNLTNAPGVRVWRAGTNDSRVSIHNRVIERHTSRCGV